MRSDQVSINTARCRSSYVSSPQFAWAQLWLLPAWVHVKDCELAQRQGPLLRRALRGACRPADEAGGQRRPDHVGGNPDGAAGRGAARDAAQAAARGLAVVVAARAPGLGHLAGG